MSKPKAEPEADPYLDGYRAGYLAGYENGITDGQMQGFADAKRRAYLAVEDDLDATEALRELVGER